MSFSNKSSWATSNQENNASTHTNPGVVSLNGRNDLRNSVIHISPYVESEIVALDVGSSAARFLVHSYMLQKSAPLFALASKEQPVSLPKLEEGPAHTFFHYLYAGTFERKVRHAPVTEFRHSTCVYCAAVQYQLPSLAELSKDEIVQAGEDLPVFDILRVARDQAFTLLPEGDAWYSEYLEKVIQKAMAKDPEPFRRPDFITRVEGNSRLLQIVWKTVMSNYTATPAPTDVEPLLESGTETSLAESMLTESEDPTHSSLHQLPSPTESVLDSPSTPKEADDLKEPEVFDLDQSTPSNIKVASLADRKHVNPDARIDATSNDDLGLPDIEPMIQQPQAMNLVAEPIEARKPEHVRADSVVQEDAAPSGSNFDIAKCGAENEAVPTAHNEDHNTTKKIKKKGRKKHSSIVF